MKKEAYDIKTLVKHITTKMYFGFFSYLLSKNRKKYFLIGQMTIIPTVKNELDCVCDKCTADFPSIFLFISRLILHD